MYIGRAVIAGYTNEKKVFLGYILASMSFPERRARIDEESIKIEPLKTADYNNPYITYNCMKKVEKDKAVVSNGIHTDVIANKLDSGYSGRDAIAISLFAMDYEKDEYNTPRIAACFDNRSLYIGIIEKEKIIIDKVRNDRCMLISTYNKTVPEEISIKRSTAKDIAKELCMLDYEHIICSAVVCRREENDFEFATEEKRL